MATVKTKNGNIDNDVINDLKKVHSMLSRMGEKYDEIKPRSKSKEIKNHEDSDDKEFSLIGVANELCDITLEVDKIASLSWELSNCGDAPNEVSRERLALIFYHIAECLSGVSEDIADIAEKLTEENRKVKYTVK